MIFRLAFEIIKRLRWIITILLVVGGALLVAAQYQTIKAGPWGSFLPDLTWESVSQSLPSFEVPTVSVSQTPAPTKISDTALTTIKTVNGPVVFTVEIADSDEERALGLMYRTSLAPYAGMYFIFEKDIQGGFWMKNCEIPLDMLFIDSEGKIIDIRENVRPCKELDPAQTVCPSYSPNSPYRYVLEINSGAAKKNSIKLGDNLTLGK
jgi:uncharacterized membrane protein (UPF0127 family)